MMNQKNIVLLITTFLMGGLNLQGAAFPDETTEAFFSACRNGDLEIIEFILSTLEAYPERRKQLINYQDQDGNTPLLLVLSSVISIKEQLAEKITSAYELHYDHIRSLENDPDALLEFFNSLTLSEVGQLNLTITKLCTPLLNAHPNLNIQNNEKETALLYYIKHLCSSLEFIEILLNAGANPNIKDSENQNTFDHILASLHKTQQHCLSAKLLFSKTDFLKKKTIEKYVTLLKTSNDEFFAFAETMPWQKEKIIKLQENFAKEIREISLLIAKKGLPKDPLYSMGNGYRPLCKFSIKR